MKDNCSDALDPEEADDLKPTERMEKVVDVKWATSAGDFIPFTALPARFHGKKVKLVICD